ncbi:hypothetical protein F7725_013781 [Dissostichus mawsoni]|uniref:SNTX thioredoxin-like domain-containing protein n=1 Tax=Dissostichus mawsoni TaxID=36200 RepID=A0A7J5YV64_DISMA|nr:hypothetical protein F7725_013781 [Dissostichus mawsoni]
MEGVKIVLNQTELDREVLASGVEDVLCFVFTSMLKGDIYLDEMADFEINQFGQRAEEQRKFRFLITAKTNDNYKGATIYHYKKGRLVTEDFQRQKPSSVETITDKRDLIWCNELYLENTRGVFSLMKPVWDS